jgi:hypothetical protein
MDREQFVRSQERLLDEVFSLTAGEEEARARFERLALDTFEIATSAGNHVHAFSLCPEPAGSFSTRYQERDVTRVEGVTIPRALVPRWQAWVREYHELRARNPRLELRDMMHHIGESNTASSWPFGYERPIQDWVDEGDPTAPPPFEDRYGIITPEFYQRLRELRQRCGGWLYWSDDVEKVVFASEPEWQRIRAAQEELEERQKRHWEENKARSERFAKRLSEVLATARADAAFWNELRDWELAREAQRPPDPPPRSAPERPSTPGRLAWRRASAEEQARSDNPPVDQIFADFIARVREPQDVLTVRDIVLNLRSEIRRELGLDNLIGWAGGPGLGQSHRS